jgi:hypothetical protein
MCTLTRTKFNSRTVASAGSPCSGVASSTQCSFGSYCSSTGYCRCPANHILLANGTCIIPTMTSIVFGQLTIIEHLKLFITILGNPGSACTLNVTVCMGNSFCARGYCLCQSNTVSNSRGICVPYEFVDVNDGKSAILLVCHCTLNVHNHDV